MAEDWLLGGLNTARRYVGASVAVSNQKLAPRPGRGRFRGTPSVAGIEHFAAEPWESGLRNPVNLRRMQLT